MRYSLLALGLVSLTGCFGASNAPSSSGSGTTTTTTTTTNTPSDPQIQIVDRHGTGYANAKFRFSGASSDFTTDGSGITNVTATLNQVFTLASDSSTTVTGTNSYAFIQAPSVTITNMNAVADITVQQIAYSEIQQAEAGSTSMFSCNVANGSMGCFANTTLYVAQAFELSTADTICQVGMGVVNNGAQAYSIEVYSDSAGKPGSSLASANVGSTSPFVSDGQTGVAVDFCASGNGVSISANTPYWAVMKFASVPGSINVNNISTNPSYGSLYQSADGATWNAVSLFIGKKLQLWVTH